MIRCIVFLCLVIFMISCNGIFSEPEKVKGKQYTVSGYLTPIENYPDSVWALVPISVYVLFDKKKFPVGWESEEHILTTDENGYFSVTYSIPDHEASRDPYKVDHLVLYAEKDSLNYMYTTIVKECNISNYNFVLRGLHNDHIPQGVCD